MTTKEFLARFKEGTKWSCKHTYLKSSETYFKEYTEILKVFSIKRIRRQWGIPGKEITFAVYKDKKINGYTSITTNTLDESIIEENKGIITVVIKNYDENCRKIEYTNLES